MIMPPYLRTYSSLFLSLSMSSPRTAPGPSSSSLASALLLTSASWAGVGGLPWIPDVLLGCYFTT